MYTYIYIGNFAQEEPDWSSVLFPRNVETIFPAAAMDTALAVIKDICKNASGGKMFNRTGKRKNHRLTQNE